MRMHGAFCARGGDIKMGALQACVEMNWLESAAQLIRVSSCECMQRAQMQCEVPPPVCRHSGLLC